MSAPGVEGATRPLPESDREFEDGGYFDRANPYIAAMVEPGHRRILEVGCGAAALGASCKAADPSREVWGLEIDAAAGAMASRRIDRVLRTDLDSLDELPESAGLFDLITFGDVLEHLRDPDHLLRVLSRYMAPAGEIVACVPNVGHWSIVVQLLQGRFNYEEQGLLDRTHIHLFTPDTFQDMLAGCGLGAVTDVQPILVQNPVSEQLSHLGAALAGDPTSQPALRRSLDTYQTVFRARPPVRGPMTRFLVVADGSSGEALDAVRAFRAGFRGGEPVHLTVISTGPPAELAELLATGDELPRPTVDIVSRSSTEDGPALPPGPDRTVAVGAAAAAMLPGRAACAPTRVDMLRALYAAGC